MVFTPASISSTCAAPSFEEDDLQSRLSVSATSFEVMESLESTVLSCLCCRKVMTPEEGQASCYCDICNESMTTLMDNSNSEGKHIFYTHVF